MRKFDDARMMSTLINPQVINVEISFDWPAIEQKHQNVYQFALTVYR